MSRITARAGRIAFNRSEVAEGRRGMTPMAATGRHSGEGTPMEWIWLGGMALAALVILVLGSEEFE